MATIPTTVAPGHPGALDRAGVQTEISNQVETSGSIDTAARALINSIEATVTQALTIEMTGAISGSDEAHAYHTQGTGEDATLMGLRYSLFSGNDSAAVDFDIELNDSAITELSGLGCCTVMETFDLTTPVALTDGDKFSVAVNTAHGCGDGRFDMIITRAAAITI